MLSATVPYGHDIFQPASGIGLGAGWHDMENYLGENFRWVGSMCELLIRLPQGPPRNLLLQMEAGPSAGKRGLQLRVEDDCGAELCTVNLRRIHLVSVPINWEHGRTKVIRLRAIGGGAMVPGDNRILNFRVFWAGWSASAASKTPDPSSRSLYVPESPRFDPRIEWGQGWSEFRRDPFGDSYRETTGDAGEVLLRLPGQSRAELEADIRPAESSAPGAHTVQVLDEAGRRIPVTRLENGLHRLSLPVKEDATSVYRIQCLDGREKPTPFRLYRLQWADVAPVNRATAHRSAAAPATNLHTNACGDFTLMAKEHWFDVRAYPEWDLYSFHIDSMLCYAAHHSGALECVLKEPMRIYHIEHARGSGWTPEGESQLFERLRAKNVSWIEYQELVTWIAQMRRLDSPMIFNRDNWGLADLQLPEKWVDGGAQIAD